MNSELVKLLSDPWERLTSGKLYKILIKGDENDEDAGLEAPFIPNEHQIDFLENLHYRNIILKARQLGFTTAIAIYYLDCCLFRENVRAGMIAQDKPTAESLFRDKVKFAYDNLPPALRARMPLQRDSASELLFAHNNSAIKVSTSMRSGTLQYLHVSEFGKICAKFPDKAKEVLTGSIPAVAPDGIIVIESTAEGQDGAFYKMSETARKNKELERPLSKKDYRFHFYPWWGAKEYRLPADGIIITAKDHAYFDGIEQDCGTVIDNEQRAWWVATRDTDFSGESEKMWQEYPSTPAEAFQKSKEGCFYTEQFTRIRKEGRICRVPYRPGIPVNTFWDIGNSDGTAIWFHQRLGLQDLFIGFDEGWGESYEYFVKRMQAKGWLWGKHYLPHDGAHARQGQSANLSPQQMLQNLGLQNVVIVPRVSELIHGINKTREVLMGDTWFDETECKAGLVHLESYTRKFNKATGQYTSEPVKADGHSEASDALRQFAQIKHQIDAPQRAPQPLPLKTTGGWMS